MKHGHAVNNRGTDGSNRWCLCIHKGRVQTTSLPPALLHCSGQLQCADSGYAPEKGVVTTPAVAQLELCGHAPNY